MLRGLPAFGGGGGGGGGTFSQFSSVKIESAQAKHPTSGVAPLLRVRRGDRQCRQAQHGLSD